MSHNTQVLVFLIGWVLVIEQGRLYSKNDIDLPAIMHITRPILFVVGIAMSAPIGIHWLISEWKSWLLWTVVGGIVGPLIGPLLTQIGLRVLEVAFSQSHRGR